MNQYRCKSAHSLVPWGLLGMLLLVAGSEGYLERHALDFIRPEFFDWRSSTRATRRQAASCQVLCFGTSRLQQGILPRVVQQRSGLRTWNLSVCWGQAPANYFLLKRALDSGARPSAVVVEYHPQCLAGDHWQAIGFYPELLGAGESLDLAWTARDAEFLARTVLAHGIPSIKDRLQIRANILAALRGERRDELARTSRAILRNKKRNQGALLAIKNTKFQGEINGPIAAGLLPDSWKCDPVNATYIRRMLDLTTERGITVYWLMLPYCPELQARREQKGLAALYSEFLRGFQERYPNLVVLDAERSGYGASVFLDPAHLDRQGACTLSADLGDLLRVHTGRKGGPRRIALPAYRDREPEVSVEDVAETQVVLASKKARR